MRCDWPHTSRNLWDQPGKAGEMDQVFRADENEAFRGNVRCHLSGARLNARRALNSSTQVVRDLLDCRDVMPYGSDSCK
jgi:hypothetical protein